MPTVEKWVLRTYGELARHVEEQMLARGVEAAQVEQDDNGGWRALVRVTKRLPRGERTATGGAKGIAPLGAIFEAFAKAEKIHGELAAHSREREQEPEAAEASS